MIDFLLLPLVPLCEIAIIAIFLNYLLSFFWHVRAVDLALSLSGFLFLFFLSTWVPLPVVHTLITLMANIIIMAILIIFQSELRSAFSRISIKTTKSPKQSEKFEKFLEQLTNSIYKMAEQHIGALVVLERNDSLEDYAKNSILLNADFSPELMETIFQKSSSLHDGAIIIRKNKILSGSVILPLAESPYLQKTLGTRHRAAIGLSLFRDAVIIVVSEKQGKVSIAREGIITRGIKLERFQDILRNLFQQEQHHHIKKNIHHKNGL